MPSTQRRLFGGRRLLLLRSAYQSASPCFPKSPASQSPQYPLSANTVSQHGTRLGEQCQLLGLKDRLNSKQVGARGPSRSPTLAKLKMKSQTALVFDTSR